MVLQFPTSQKYPKSFKERLWVIRTLFKCSFIHVFIYLYAYKMTNPLPKVVSPIFVTENKGSLGLLAHTIPQFCVLVTISIQPPTINISWYAIGLSVQASCQVALWVWLARSPVRIVPLASIIPLPVGTRVPPSGSQPSFSCRVVTNQVDYEPLSTFCSIFVALSVPHEPVAVPLPDINIVTMLPTLSASIC